jgi:hypothetical protein
VPDPITFAFSREDNAAHLSLTKRIDDMPGPTLTVAVEVPESVRDQLPQSAVVSPSQRSHAAGLAS